MVDPWMSFPGDRMRSGPSTDLPSEDQDEEDREFRERGEKRGVGPGQGHWRSREGGKCANSFKGVDVGAFFTKILSTSSISWIT